MKLKYYIRGVGMGVVVTTIILTIAFNIRQQDTAGGMESQGQTNNLDNILGSVTEPSTEKQSESVSEPVTETVSESASIEETATQTEPVQEPVTIDVDLTGLVSSEQVSNLLAQVGIISDAADFNNYMAVHGYDVKIWPKAYTLTKGSDYETIARIICGLS